MQGEKWKLFDKTYGCFSQDKTTSDRDPELTCRFNSCLVEPTCLSARLTEVNSLELEGLGLFESLKFPFPAEATPPGAVMAPTALRLDWQLALMYSTVCSLRSLARLTYDEFITCFFTNPESTKSKQIPGNLSFALICSKWNFI